MSSVRIPPLQFSNWYVWEYRNRFPKVEFPGVYVLSIINSPDLVGQRPYWHDVVYVGMTNSRGGLRSRWNQFNRATRGKGGHSGGNSIYQELGHYSTWGQSLYVAGMAIECNVTSPSGNDYLRMGWVAYLEFEAFSSYCEKVGGHPRFNKQ